MYSHGQSIKEISKLTGFAYSTIRDQLEAGGVTLRPKFSVSFSERQRHQFKSSAPPPFGFFYLNGTLERDAREFPTLQVIWNQWQLGQNATAIARLLNCKKLKTRGGKEWKRETILNILDRFENKIISLKEGTSRKPNSKSTSNPQPTTLN